MGLCTSCGATYRPGIATHRDGMGRLGRNAMRRVSTRRGRTLRRWARSIRLRSAVAVLATATIIIGMPAPPAAAAPPSPTPAPGPTARHRPPATSARDKNRPQPNNLTPMQSGVGPTREQRKAMSAAAAKARATGKPVVVDELTTETELVSANPERGLT